MADYEYGFDPDESNNTAASIYLMARDGGSRVLDIGSGPGVVAGYLAANDGKQVTCIDRSAESLEIARERGVSRTIPADLSGSGWAEDLDGESFDVIVLADVLEHLVDPGQVLEAIGRHELLAKDGYLVVSIPNAGHEAVLAELINGRFTYQETGLLDSTHLRFFTLVSLRELLERFGFFVTVVERTHRTAEQTSLAIHDVVLPPELRDRVLEAAAEAQTFQFIVRAEPATAARELAVQRQRVLELEAAVQKLETTPGGAGAEGLERQIEQLRAELDATAVELAESRADQAQLRQRLVDTEDALRRERTATAAERKRYEQAIADAKLGAADGALSDANRKVERLEKKLADVYESRTWKAGRVVWSVAQLPKKLGRRRPLRESPVMPKPQTDGPAVPDHGFELVEDLQARHQYEAALERRSFSGQAKAVVFAVSTSDLDAGRGDLYTAIGLGRRLEDVGYEVIYLPRERWYELPTGTDIYVSMLETVEVSRLPSDLITVAWVRNQTAVWAQQPWLGLYRMVLASSQESLDVLSSVYAGPMGLLAIGVDTDLFSLASDGSDRSGVASTVNQWGREREVFAFLKERPITFPLTLYGQQRGQAEALEKYAHGPVSFFALPSLYRQARIVLDDFNHTTAGFGNVNSRLFEAAACGATVLTNRRSGLNAVGLEAISVYGSSADLFSLIDRDLGSAEAQARADELAALVAERHSYRKRATEFDVQLQRLDESPEALEGHVIGYFPNYVDNPYTSMMWSELRKDGAVAIPVSNALDFAATVRAADYRPTVFHLNWTAPILGAANDEHDRLVRYRRFLEALEEMRAREIRSIWTVHNAMPHECSDLDLEAKLRQGIADRVDVIHVMCDKTAAACSEWFDIPQSKVRVIPHPSYIDVYPNLVDKHTARSTLGLSDDDYVYLHFGQVRGYKGLDRLLDAFDQVSRHDSAAKLLMVGKPGRFEGVREIMDRARANPNVISNFNPVPDADVQLYMNASDVVVLPHQTALNSGALLLAYSFARPVITSETGCLTELVDETTGLGIDWNDGDRGLLNAMLSAPELGEDHGRAGYRRAEDLHYLKVGERFAELVRSLR